MSLAATLLPAFGAGVAAFAALYFFARRWNNFGVVDVAWAAGFTPLVAWYAWAGDAPAWRKLLLLTPAVAWSLRLAWHLGVRVWQHHPTEDGRYVRLREAWGAALPSKMFWFFQAQVGALVALAWPFLLVSRHPSPHPHWFEVAGALLVLAALGGEALADAQLARFKREVRDRSRVCDVGLWRLSRHPNYFFEWLVWVGFALAAAPAPLGWTAFASPALMLYLLLFQTGIHYTEAHLERSKGAAWRAYRARTSAFVPWFPRKPVPDPS